MRTIIIFIFVVMLAGTCTSCASAKIPPIYENDNCSITITPGKIKIKLKTIQEAGT